MQSVLQKIDRVAKPIRKNNKVVSENLNAKNIYLEEENFDILKLLQSRQAENFNRQEGVKPNRNKRKRDVSKEHSPRKSQDFKRTKVSEPKALNRQEMITPRKVSPGILTPESRNSPQAEYGFSRELIKDP